jgi:hypothetical protein
MTWNEALGEPGLSHPNMFAFYIRAELWLDNRSHDEFAEGCGLTLNEVRGAGGHPGSAATAGVADCRFLRR